MAEEPLYYGKNVKKVVNPIKIAPQISRLQHKKQVPIYQQGSKLLLPEKEKKITKQDPRKHYRTKICPYGRDCRKRFTCTFAHNEQELRKPFIKRKKPCLLYQRGQCSLGSACRDYHGNMDLQKNYKYKQKICEEYLNGSCLKGIVCIYLHEDPKKQQLIDEEINQSDREQIVEQAVEKDEGIPQKEQEKGSTEKNKQKQKQDQVLESDKDAPEQQQPLFIGF